MTTITATHNGTAYHPIFICQEWQPRQVSEPWTPAELIVAMIRDGWRPTRVPGRYIHKNTHYEIDINKLDKQGDPDWMNWAVARQTPPPF